MTEETNIVTVGSVESWWSPDGWQTASVPPAFVQFWNTEDWETGRREAGYQTIRSSHEFITPSCEILRHEPSGHLLILLEGRDRFFVDAADAAAFWTDKYPVLVRVEMAERQADAAEQLAKAMLGFVRHGHGTWVIDELGTRSKEQREHEDAVWAHRKQANAANK